MKPTKIFTTIFIIILLTLGYILIAEPQFFIQKRNPSVTITSPENGVTYKVGDEIKITYSAKNMPGHVRFETSIDVHGQIPFICTLKADDNPSGNFSTITLGDTVCANDTYTGMKTELGNPYTFTVTAIRTLPNDNTVVAVSDNPINLKILPR